MIAFKSLVALNRTILVHMHKPTFLSVEHYETLNSYMSGGRESPFQYKAVIFIVTVSCDRNLLVSSTPSFG